MLWSAQRVTMPWSSLRPLNAVLALLMVMSATCQAAGGGADNCSTSNANRACTAAIVSELVSASYRWNSTNETTRFDLIRAQLDAYTQQCMGAAPTNLLPLRLVSIDQMRTQVDAAVASFTAGTGWPVTVKYFSSFRVIQEIRDNAVKNNTADAYIFSNKYVSDVVQTGVAAALEPVIQTLPPQLQSQWLDVTRYYRDTVSFSGRVHGVPVAGAAFTLFYRKDVLDALGEAPPQTWDDLVDLAEKYNGTDFDGDGVPYHAMCHSLNRGCMGTNLLISIAASMLQYQGPRQGFWLDPTTMEPLLDNPAMQRALAIYRRLALLNPDFPLPAATPRTNSSNSSSSNTTNVTRPSPSPNRTPTTGFRATEPGCFSGASYFLAGKCLFHIGNFSVLKATLNTSHPLRGKIGGWAVPGSTLIYDRAARVLRLCGSDGSNTQLCPWAVPSILRNGSTMLVNSAPWKSSVGGYTGIVSATAASDIQTAALSLLFRTLDTDFQYQMAADPSNWFVPLRTSLISTSALDRWVQMGFDQETMRVYLAALRSHLDGTNRVLPTGLPEIDTFQSLWEVAATNVSWLNSTNFSQVASAMQQTMRDLMTAQGGDDALRPAYYASLGLSMPPPAPPPPAPVSSKPTQESEGLAAGSLAAAIVVPCVVVLVLAVVLVLYIRSNRNRDLMGRVLPPPASPQTTLLITDIQSSTSLWESLTTDVMDEAMKLHDSILRDLLREHSGTETRTEGDSFICAFWTAEDAVNFSLDLQQQLLTAPWPEALLQHAEGREIKVAKAAVLQFIGGTPHARPNAEARTDASTNDGTASGPLRHPGIGQLAPLAISRVRSLPSLGFTTNIVQQAMDGQSSPTTPSRSRFNFNLAPTSSNAESGLPPNSGSGRLSVVPPSPPLSPPCPPPPAPPPASCGPAAHGGADTVPDLVNGTAPHVTVMTSPVKQRTSRTSLTSRASRNSNASHASRDNCQRTAEVAGAAGAQQSHRSITSKWSFRRPGRTTSRASMEVEFLEKHPDLNPFYLAMRDTGVTRQSAGKPLLPPGICGGATRRAPPPTTMQWAEATAAMWPKVDGDIPELACEEGQQQQDGTAKAAEPMVILRGLRVRVGMQSGVAQDDVLRVGDGDHQVQYSGDSFAMCKAISDAACGGGILASWSTVAQLPADGTFQRRVVMYAGHHLLNGMSDPVGMYHVVSPSLLLRLAHLPSPRSMASTTLSCLQAPVGVVSIVFVNVAFFPQLVNAMPHTAHAALKLAMAEMQRILFARQGYEVEVTVDGLLLAAFASARQALVFACECNEAMLQIKWPTELLEHELGEEQYDWKVDRAQETQVNGPLGRAQADDSGEHRGSAANRARARRVVRLRGLRLKIGADMDEVLPRLDPGSGRAGYRGRVMNRAARLASRAAGGKVLCSERMWSASKGEGEEVVLPLDVDAQMEQDAGNASLFASNGKDFSLEPASSATWDASTSLGLGASSRPSEHASTSLGLGARSRPSEQHMASQHGVQAPAGAAVRSSLEALGAAVAAVGRSSGAAASHATPSTLSDVSANAKPATESLLRNTSSGPRSMVACATPRAGARASSLPSALPLLPSQGEPQRQLPELRGIHLGRFALKGIPDPVEVVEVTLKQAHVGSKALSSAQVAGNGS